MAINSLLIIELTFSIPGYTKWYELLQIGSLWFRQISCLNFFLTGGFQNEPNQNYVICSVIVTCLILTYANWNIKQHYNKQTLEIRLAIVKDKSKIHKVLANLILCLEEATGVKENLEAVGFFRVNISLIPD